MSYLSQMGHVPGVEEHAFRGGGLPGVNVGQDSHIADLVVWAGFAGGAEATT